jgi:hypothetical protein
MGYEIRIASQVERWLAELRDRDPAAADRIDEAVATLRADGEGVGPPLVVPVDDPVRAGGRTAVRRSGTPARVRMPWRGKPASDIPRWLLGRFGFWMALPGLDAACQRQRVTLTHVRRAVADVATSRKRLEQQIEQLDQRGLGQGELPSLRRQYADMQAKEERLQVASRRLQAQMNAFLVGKEAVEAAYAAAEEAAEAAWAEVTGTVSSDAEGAGSAVSEAGNADLDGPAQPTSWLRELRPGAPESASTRILFTVEPPGTAVLLAAGMENDWLRAWYTEAITLCRIRYQRMHGGTR